MNKSNVVFELLCAVIEAEVPSNTLMFRRMK